MANLIELGKAYLNANESKLTPLIKHEFKTWVDNRFDLISQTVEVIFTDVADTYADTLELTEGVELGWLYTWADSTDSLMDGETNRKFRSVHDIDHVDTGLTFSPEDERLITIYTLKNARKDGLSIPTLEFIYSEIAGQAAAYAALGGQFAEQKFARNLPGFKECFE